MKAFMLVLLIGLQIAAAPKVTVPSYPPMAFHGGTVVAEIELWGKPENRVAILHAEEPFAKVVRDALSQWRFPAGLKNTHAVVVINFRDSVMPLSRSIECPQSKHHLAVPNLIVDPLYPDSPLRIIWGGVVVRLTVSETGNVKHVETIQRIDEFSQCVTEAVMQWKFRPALDESGEPTESEAYAVCVYRPQLNPNNY